MSVRVTMDGSVWEFDTAAEAAEFRRQVMAQKPAANEPQRGAKLMSVLGPRTRRVAETRPRRTDAEAENRSKAATLSDASRAILDALAPAVSGIQSEALATAIGKSGPRDLPIKIMNLKKELIALDLPVMDVIVTDTIYVKGRKRSVYKPGPRIADALRRNGNLFGGK